MPTDDQDGIYLVDITPVVEGLVSQPVFDAALEHAKADYPGQDLQWVGPLGMFLPMKNKKNGPLMGSSS